MSARYIRPSQVISPKSSVRNVTPLYDGGPEDFAVAALRWKGTWTVGARWNGTENPDGSLTPGMPQSRGLPAWFVFPDQLIPPLLHALAALGMVGGGEIPDDEAQHLMETELDRWGQWAPEHGLDDRVKDIVRQMKARGEI